MEKKKEMLTGVERWREEAKVGANAVNGHWNRKGPGLIVRDRIEFSVIAECRRKF